MVYKDYFDIMQDIENIIDDYKVKELPEKIADYVTKQIDEIKERHAEELLKKQIEIEQLKGEVAGYKLQLHSPRPTTPEEHKIRAITAIINSNEISFESYVYLGDDCLSIELKGGE
ncbi:MAG: hypothetical protein ABF633_03450 [Clostridium sp.]|uniref:hypothetical protein n=1 Tax=Clostridium sp. TaxID=1506 RepID=UPI0039E88539